MNYYRLLPFPNQEDKFENFKRNNSVSIAWDKLGDVNGLERADIKKKFLESYPEESSNQLVPGFFLKLLEMKPGDIILIPYSNQYHIFEVVGQYYFDVQEKDISLKHRIDVRFLRTAEKNEFSTKMQASIAARPTLTSLNEYSADLEAFINNNSPMSVSQKNSFTFSDHEGSIVLSFSDNISKKRIEKFFNKVLDQI
ncbi:hypothetical protein ACFX18_03115 [Lactococcus garvieae]|uniref:Uncharacterized protein n=1 Tax=Lactococcus garvieae TaxID=1363 RepID=A0AA46TXQ1_9LACT|nr:hypothetical protein [Lactococcus garvieae]UYT11298.1 hypothetical protein OF801_04950 [Lactococcus garvieae]UYT13239.1 hypothetical protein OF800_04425 [Lactococcus garvieae]